MASKTPESTFVKSMTGFSRIQDSDELGDFTWEMRSVNHRYLETQFKMPEKFKHLEPKLREILRSIVARGKIESNLYLKLNTSSQDLAINEDKLNQILNVAGKLEEKSKDIKLLSSFEILNWPGLLEASEIDLSSLEKKILSGFEAAVNELVNARTAEGKRMSEIILNRVGLIEDLVEEIRSDMPTILEDYNQRLKDKLSNFNVEVDPDRLEQELVMLAQKTDVAEELDRLVAHTSEVRDTLKKSEPCGRRLDFLMQELNREANTLGAKSIAIKSSQGSISLKVLIEQMREQVQNIE